MILAEEQEFIEWLMENGWARRDAEAEWDRLQEGDFD